MHVSLYVYVCIYIFIRNQTSENLEIGLVVVQIE